MPIHFITKQMRPTKLRLVLQHGVAGGKHKFYPETLIVYTVREKDGG